MQVVLLERIYKLGQMGDVVSVKPGYARNFLLPQNKAMRATKANLVKFEEQRVQLEARNLDLKNEASSVSEKLEGNSFVVIRQAGDTGQLYGSVATRDLAEVITEGGFSIKRGQVMLDRPIKMLGIHPIRISLHPEVEVSVTVNVARTEEEADRQARGEDVTAITEEEMEGTISAADVFSEDDDHDDMAPSDRGDEAADSETVSEDVQNS